MTAIDPDTLIDDTTFADLGLAQPLLAALSDAGYERPTPIQRDAIPLALKGRDLIGLAQTGTGKTASFTLPMVHRLLGGPRRTRVLVLTPTRELCLQVEESVRKYSKYAPVDVIPVFGGVGYEPQERALRAGVDVVVATPGRLLAHLEKRNVDFSYLETLVLDAQVLGDILKDADPAKRGFNGDALAKITDYFSAKQATMAAPLREHAAAQAVAVTGVLANESVAYTDVKQGAVGDCLSRIQHGDGTGRLGQRRIIRALALTS